MKTASEFRLSLKRSQPTRFPRSMQIGLLDATARREVLQRLGNEEKPKPR
jgi:hypothetical protein